MILFFQLRKWILRPNHARPLLSQLQRKKKKKERKPFLGACSRTKGIITIFFIYIFSTGYDNDDDDDDNNNNNDNNNNTPMKNGVVYKKIK